jgi:Cft2 family RNA processing exonuclease
MKITFCGASGEIGASCILVEVENKRVLLDSGIRLSGEPLPNFRTIQEEGGIDCIVISHAHTDHTGSLPVIAKEYSDIDIFMTHPTRDITQVLLYDSLKIMNYKESEIPIFAENDVLNMLKRIKCHNFLYEFKPFKDKDITITFYPAGHIAGASCVFIQSKEGSIFYTGDFSVTNQKTVSGASIPKLRPDVMITESTYGDKLHSNRKIEEDKLISLINEVYDRGGKILIPAFAVGRAQEVILILRSAISKKQIKPFPIYVDGMVKEICNVYKNYPNYLREELAKRIWREKSAFYSENIIPITSQELRQEIINKDEPCCVISSSGMLSGGFSVFYAEHFSKSEKNHIAITGYQDEESPGRNLLSLADSEEKLWKLNDKYIPLLCGFGKYSLSAHADKMEILGLVEKLQPRKLFLIHGSSDVLKTLGEEVTKQKIERVREIFIPKNGESFNISFHNPRKQFEKIQIKSLEKKYLPNSSDLEELSNYLLLQNRKYGYVVEELLYLWLGINDFSEDETLKFQNILNESNFFKKDTFHLSIFHPIIKEERIAINVNNNFMEGNQVLKLAETHFENFGLSKKGLRVDEKIVLLSFNFPKIILLKHQDLIKSFEEITKWKIEVNPNFNKFIIEDLIRELLDEDLIMLDKMAYYPLEDKYKVAMLQKPEYEEEVENIFFERTQIKLEFDYPNKFIDIPKEEKFQPIVNKMNQISALSFIENVFYGFEDKLFKKSVKQNNSGDKIIELSFISPIIGEKYKNVISDLEKEVGWEIVISNSSNQIEIIQIALTLLKCINVNLKKNPSIIETQKIAKIKTEDIIDEEKWKKLQEEFYNKTGFNIEKL